MPVPDLDRRRLLRPALVVFGLAGAGVAGPLLDIYGRNPEVFVANRSTGGQIVLFGLIAALAVPVFGLAVLIATMKIGPRTNGVAYFVLVALTSSASGLVVSRQVVPNSTIGAVALAGAIAATVMVFYKTRWLETVLVFFSAIGPVALVLYLAVSPTSRLIWADPAQAALDPTAVGRPASIVFLQLDELPLASLLDTDGSINEALFPNFARLAGSSHWYRNAFSNSIATTQSVPANLTGNLGRTGASPSSVDHPNNLFTLLGPDYEMHVIEWLTDLCPKDLCKDFAGRGPARFGSLLQDVGVVYGHVALPLSAREQLPSLDGSWKGFLGQTELPEASPVDVGDLQVPKAGTRSGWIDWMQRIIEGIQTDETPTLHFAHLQTPHIPWRTNPSGTHYDRPEEYTEVDGVEISGYWVKNPNLPRLGFQRHLYQLGFFDNRLGALFDRLEETGNWDNTMIVLVSDHGASFGAGENRRWPIGDNLGDLYRVPLFVKLPGQRVGEVHDEPAYGIDVLPTIVDALDISTDWTFDGQSLLTIEATDRPHRPVFWCCTREGADTDLDSLYAAVRRNHEWIPDQKGWVGVASVGPYRDLVGRAMAELAPRIDESLQWSFVQADRLAAVDRASGFVPTLLSGRVQIPEGVEGDDLLFAVNGTVAGTGFLIRESATTGELRGLLAEELIGEGTNTVTLLVPDPSGTGWLTGAAANLAITYLADDGHVLDVRPEGNRLLEIDGVKATAEGWVISGWTADIRQKLTADRIYVFVADQLVAFGPPNKDNKNVVVWHKSDNLLRSGFTFTIPNDLVSDELERLTVIAEFGSYAISSPATLTR